MPRGKIYIPKVLLKLSMLTDFFKKNFLHKLLLRLFGNSGSGMMIFSGTSASLLTTVCVSGGLIRIGDGGRTKISSTREGSCCSAILNLRLSQVGVNRRFIIMQKAIRVAMSTTNTTTEITRATMNSAVDNNIVLQKYL